MGRRMRRTRTVFLPGQLGIITDKEKRNRKEA
jgi:hypothetical protein